MTKVQFGLKGYGPEVELDNEGRVLGTKEPLPPAEVGSAREAISRIRLTSFQVEDGWGISFDHLEDEGLIYAFKQMPAPDERVKWVSFRLGYVDSGFDSAMETPDPEV